jgi:geranylgeranyl diphosphate synthase type I
MDIEREMKAYCDIFNKALESYLYRNDSNNLFEAARHLPLAGGKRIRPFLAMLSCKATGGSSEDIISFGLALEIAHNFSLVHDDIMDKSTLRRNIQTVHIKYGEPVAILAGDLLFIRSFEVLDYYQNPMLYAHINRKFIQAVADVCEGQYLDMSFEKRLSVTKDEYIEMISKKTAALFRAATEGGSIVSGASSDVQMAMNTYGKSLGLAFQIRDDALDMSSDTETLGKDIGNDIRNGKKTLIAVHALQHASGYNKTILSSLFGNPKASDEDIKKVHKVFQDVGSIQFAEMEAKKYSMTALNALSVLPESHEKEVLMYLAEYAVTRVK